MTKLEWLRVAYTALVNAGLTPSEADDILDRAGFDWLDAHGNGRNPTPEDWEAAYQSGGMRIES